ncbi:MAG: Fur family transcriptional regulator [Oscillospiraceae bacterium]|nr:transcriptional repressor [Oscillospiraceae bacterium]
MRSEGYSTKLYNSILDFLSKNRERAVTAANVYEHLQAAGDRANKTTVYRNMDRLVSEGKVLKYVTDDGRMASYIYKSHDDDCGEHLHLQCSGCGRVIHLDCGYMDEIIRHISSEHGFDLRCSSSILYGKCRECAQKDNSVEQEK